MLTVINGHFPAKNKHIRITPAIEEEILRRVAGGETINSMSRSITLPHRISIMAHCDKFPEFASKLAIARQVCMDVYMDEIIAIADDTSKDFKLVESLDGVITRVPDLESIARAKMRIDTRKWLMERLSPRVYGATKSLTLATGDNMPLQIAAPLIQINFNGPDDEGDQ